MQSREISANSPFAKRKQTADRKFFCRILLKKPSFSGQGFFTKMGPQIRLPPVPNSGVNKLFICQFYVDDIIFGSTNLKVCKDFSELMTREVEMSMIGELNFFLGFQIKQLKEGTFIHQEKYSNDILKKFKMEDCKPIKTPMPTNGLLDLDEGGKSVDQKLYRYMIGLYVCSVSSQP
jgi:hypothetical protein